MDWFEQLTGFREGSYEDARRQLEVNGQQLRSRVNGRSYGIGELELVSLHDLRTRAKSDHAAGQLRFDHVTGDIRQLHRAPEHAGALFQVASQFNLLEMMSSDVTPERGVTRYQHDRTQGPACAIAAGAATIYRNYFVPAGDGLGQTARRQLDGLADVGARLGEVTGLPVDRLWTMRNGYALCSREGLAAIGAWLRGASTVEHDELRSRLRIGLHRDVEVTDGDEHDRQIVSQAFCSALPVAYSSVPAAEWQPFAELVLEAAYEATLWAAVINARRGASNVVLLTRLGGGAFGNDDAWIDRALQRALLLADGHDLDVRLVRYGPAKA